MKIGKLCFGADVFQFGLELCISKSGYNDRIKKATIDTAKQLDVLLVSFFYWKDIYLFEYFKRKSGLIGKSGGAKPIIVIGGFQATLTPEICAEMADYVFIGDGEDHLGEILNDIESGNEPSCKYLYRKGDKKIPEPYNTKSLPAFMIEKGQGGNVKRVEIARGCKYKCKFCAISRLKPYREVPIGDLIDLINNNKHRKGMFSFFAPERTLYSGWDKLNEQLRLCGIQNLGKDSRLEHIHKVGGAKVTFGLDGISYSLRKSVGKPFTDELILSNLGAFCDKNAGINMVTVYFIGDLPGESDKDWDEIYSLFGKIENEKWSRKLTLIPVLNPLSPKAHTDLQYADINIFRNYRSKWQNFLRNDGKRWGFRILETFVWGNWMRLLDSVVNRCGAEGYDKVVAKLPLKLLRQPPSPAKDKRMAEKLFSEIIKNGIPESLIISGKV